jgi:hypothetical protein
MLVHLVSDIGIPAAICLVPTTFLDLLARPSLLAMSLMNDTTRSTSYKRRYLSLWARSWAKIGPACHVGLVLCTAPFLSSTENRPSFSLITASKRPARGINVVGGLQGLCQVNLVAAPRSRKFSRSDGLEWPRAFGGGSEDIP